MLMNVVSALLEAGVVVESVVRAKHAADTSIDAILDVRLGEMTARFAVEEKQRAPYPNELARLGALRQRLERVGSPTLVVPFVAESLARSLSSDGWSWADAAGNFDLRAEGLVLHKRKTTTPPRPKTKSLPQGAGGLGIVRALIRFTSLEPIQLGTTSLAAQAKVTQPRASQVLRRLLELVTKAPHGRWEPDRGALLDRFLAEYRGPGGSEHYFYSLDPPTEIARRGAQGLATRASMAVSADVGPDLLLAWRRPSVVIIYSNDVLEPGKLDLVPAQGRHDANVIIRYPDDTSLFPEPKLIAELHAVDIPLADVTQQIWDLQDLGGADRLEAAGMLRQWLLTHP
jgi:hypothetical protein